jgi:CubicO group peptidase (beta-lactamase class C family)
MSASTEQLVTHGGTVTAGFEPVQQTFIAGLKQFGEGGGGFAAYLNGQPVVDVWGGRAGARPWAEDTRAVLMSSTKGFVTLCAQILVDRQLLDIDAPVAHYWPEFAQAGKDEILVRHVLTHTSGVIGFGPHRPTLDWNGEGWDDYNAIAAGFAASTPSWSPPGDTFGYHALSYGWLMGEIVRRITGMTIGNFFRIEVVQPLSLDLDIGTPADVCSRVAPIVDHMSSDAPFMVKILLRRALKSLGDPTTLPGQAFVAKNDGSGNLFDHAEELFNTGRGLEAEIPAGNGTGTARSLARLYAMLTLNGELDGVRIVSPEVVHDFAAQQISLPDVMLTSVMPRWIRGRLSTPVRRTLGYLINPAMPGGKVHTFGPNLNAYGHDGAGGQIAYCDAENGISVGFIRSDLGSSSRFSNQLIDSLYQCAGVTTQSKNRAAA